MDCESDDIANSVRAVARFSRHPKEVHVKAARKTIECLSAAAHLGLTFRKDSKLEDAQLEYDLETYVDADYCLLYTSPSPRDKRQSRMPSSA